MRLLPAILANLLVFASALGIGDALRPLLPRAFSPLDRFAATLLAGLGLLGTVLFCVGQVWFSRTAILILQVPSALLGIRYLVREAPELRAGFSKSSVPALPAIIIAVVLVVTMVAGLAEPTGDIKLDAIAYHFLGPRVWLRDGVIRPVLDESYTAFPAVVETIFAALMTLGGQRGPEFFSLIALVAMLLLAAGLALRMGLDSSGAWWVGALIATMPALYRGAYGGFNDVILSGLVLAAARVGFDAARPAEYLLFGILCGLAMGTKYTGLIAWILLSLCVALIAIVIHKQNTSALLQRFGIASIAAIAVAAPWYARNGIVLGCPIYPPPPFLLRFFHVRYLSPPALSHLAELVRRAGQGMGQSVSSFLLLPFHLTFHPANFENGAGGIGIALLALAPFGLLTRRRDWFAKGLAAFGLLQTIVWFVTAQEARFLIHGYIIAALFAVWGWRYVVKEAPRFAPLLSALVIACSVLYGLYMIVSARVDDIHAAVSSAYEEKRRAAEVPFVESLDYLNHETAVSKVLVPEPRVPAYYLEKSYLKPVGRWGELTIPEANNLPQILSELVRLRISHVLDVRMEGADFRLGEHPQGLTLVFEGNNQRVYRAGWLDGSR